MAKVHKYVDEGRGDNWDVFVEKILGVTLSGQTPIYIAKGSDNVTYLMSTKPFNPTAYNAL